MAANHFNSHLGLALAYLIFLISIPKSLSVLEPQPAPPSVWDILPKFGLPSGLLPSTVTDYVLHDDGRFIVMLDSPCYIQFEYLVYYDKTITGKLGYGSITDLEGIQVQRFFLWFDVNEIKVDLPPSDSIYFQVGFINKKLDVDQFKTIHSCRDEIVDFCCGSNDFSGLLKEKLVKVGKSCLFKNYDLFQPKVWSVFPASKLLLADDAFWFVPFSIFYEFKTGRGLKERGRIIQ